MDPTGGVGASGEKEEAWEGAGLEMGEGKVAVLLWVVRTPGQDQAEGGGGSPLGVGGGGGGLAGIKSPHFNLEPVPQGGI